MRRRRRRSTDNICATLTSGLALEIALLPSVLTTNWNIDTEPFCTQQINYSEAIWTLKTRRIMKNTSTSEIKQIRTSSSPVSAVFTNRWTSPGIISPAQINISWSADTPPLPPWVAISLISSLSGRPIIALCIHCSSPCFFLSRSPSLRVSLLTLCCRINAGKHTVHTCSTGCKRNQQLKGKYHFIWPVTATSSQALCLPRCWVKVAQALLLLWYGL